jgi:hypothetical protein
MWAISGEKMSIQHLSWAFDLQGLSSTEKLTLLALCDRANQNGECWPAYEDILKRTGLNRKTLASTLKSLEAKYLISKDVRKGRSTVYNILAIDISTLPEPDCKQQGRPNIGTGKVGPKTVLGRPKNGTKVGPKTVLEPNKNHNNNYMGKRFTPPQVSEVQEYCTERGNKVDAERFVDFYSMKGWYVGSNKMKDWKAAVRTWEKNSTTPNTNQPKQTNNGDWF